MAGAIYRTWAQGLAHTGGRRTWEVMGATCARVMGAWGVQKVEGDPDEWVPPIRERRERALGVGWAARALAGPG